MREHGGATRPGMTLAIVGAALLAALLFAPTASAVPGGPISGEAKVGETLTASPAHFYHWQRCNPGAGPCNSSGPLWALDEGWSAIPGASGENDSTYTLTQNDLGMKIRVLSNAMHLGFPIASPAVGPVGAAAVPANTALPSISGEAREGATLTADDGSWQSAVPFDTTRQWLRSNDSGGFDPIDGATGETYDLTADDVGHEIAVRVTATNSGGDSDPATSSAVGPVVSIVPANTGAPSISGDAIQGATLTADDGEWQSTDAFETSRQWLRSDGAGGFTEIAGETGPTYTLTADDVGHEIAVRVVATNSGGDSEPATSAATATVIFAEPVNVAPPSISGDAIEGETLTGDDGEWTGDELTFERQWQRSNETGGWDDIDGATETTYTLQVADVNRRVRLRVVASNPGGDSDPAFSEPTDVVVNPPEFDSTGNLEPVSGTVLVQLPGESRVRSITELTQVPVGTVVDVVNGFVDLTTQRGPSEGLQTITLWDGAFVFGQRLKNRLTVMRLTSALTGPSTGSGAQAAGKKGKKLWGRGRCRCRTRGRNSSGTARGTWWLTAERRGGTFTKVKEGTVVVRDFTRNRKVKVTKGESYLARNR
jgi:hypothetical protein